MKYFLILGAGLAAVFLFLLLTASANTALFARQYPQLLALNGGLALALMGLVTYQLWVLRRKVKAGVFGSKLTVRLVLVFSLIAVVPGVIVYAVSVQFLEKSIESWFDVRVEKALEGGLSLGRTVLDNTLKDLSKKAQVGALALAENPDEDPLGSLNRIREQAGVQEVSLFAQNGSIIGFASGDRTSLIPNIPEASVLRQARLQKAYTAIESLPDKGLYLRVVLPVNVLSLREDIRLIQFLQPVPGELAKDAETVQSVYRDYQELSLSRSGLKRLYGITLTLALLLALLSALSLAFFLSERLSAPLGILAAGTRAVAQGDFSRLHPVRSSDELGILTHSFNVMTQQLSEARAAAERNQTQLESAKAYLESILGNLSSGVLALDRQYHLRSVNRSASAILEANLEELSGLELEKWAEHVPNLASFAQQILEAFSEAGSELWERQLERKAKGSKQVLLVRGTPLSAVAEDGFVVVFDDVTRLIQAQREAAWGEVARRLAHEIKNPLTPIQLSAERLSKKLTDKLEAPDREMLLRGTQTIVGQVAAMKSMVDAFGEYARMPEVNLEKVDFNELVREVLSLYESAGPRIELRLAPSLPSVKGDQNKLRQLIHNLLRNAQDALTDSPGAIIQVATESTGKGIRFSICDNGTGFPEQLLERVFEPYVTTKPKGTGLGLAIVKKIVEEHNGTIYIENLQPQGARVSVTLPLAEAA